MTNEVFQIAFPGTEIDEKATFERVEKELVTAALYKRFGFIRKEIRNTPAYEYRESARTNEISKPAEDAAVYNVDGAERAQKTYDRVMMAISRLKHTHREIITMRYMSDPEPYDINVWSELNLSESTYFRLKNKALSELAYALRLEVVVKPESDSDLTVS
ncbi:ArpU family phage packaging/lysis transcriptional regulator [Paenibacillus massiliensis]|uniref:ArpU family phage packaging/lysis transcriptional regulator n=1 Tax=Paenibacillus massiliensis TaxID=225917 RepID=UPI000401D07B|nr:ArpU family phage packaging/lysis transcriptional regulator [Paenibacillus massiliensis]